MHTLIERLFAATNALDVEEALALFTDDAVLGDSSVGEKFEGRVQIRRYLTQYFVGYNTVSQVLSVETAGDNHVRARVDFTGDFGHEVGLFDITTNASGEITALETYLE
jgi:ketosteroid isomerase-like protein